jgi:hypothetical protein
MPEKKKKDEDAPVESDAKAEVKEPKEKLVPVMLPEIPGAPEHDQYATVRILNRGKWTIKRGPEGGMVPEDVAEIFVRNYKAQPSIVATSTSG